MKPVILVSLIAHHTPTLILNSGISWIRMRYSADHYALFTELSY